MGNPEKRVAVRAMLNRWRRDEKRLQNLFNRGEPVSTEDLTDSGEMRRNLGTAIAYAEGFMTATGSRPVSAADGSNK